MPKVDNLGYVILEDSSTATDARLVSDKNGRLVAEACLQEAEEENRNGRVYITADLYREQTCARTKELLETGYMCGEAGHPTDTSIIRQQTIDPTNIAVRYLKYWMDGPKWMAHFKGTNNDLGASVDADLREGYRPAFSMRALGALENINGRNVVRDLKYITHDFVIFPSHPGAYTVGPVSESAVGTKKGNFEKTLITRKKELITESSLIPVMNDDVINYIKQESANIQSILKQFELFYESMTYDPKTNRVTLKAKGTNDVFVINCESYIQNEIENYCYNLMNKA